MIEAIDVTVRYKSGLFGRGSFDALKGFSAVARDGVSTGIIGANGAGKTTLFKACAGLCKIERGRILVDGIDPSTHPEAARALLSLLPENPSIPFNWTGLDALRAGAALRGLFGASAKTAIEREAHRWSLESFISKRSAGLSRGQLARVALAREALRPAHNIILDEPTAGLDFASAAEVRSWARELATSGHCILVATHIVSEIKAMCPVVVGLKDGVAWSSQAAHEWIDAAAGAIALEDRDGME